MALLAAGKNPIGYRGITRAGKAIITIEHQGLRVGHIVGFAIALSSSTVPVTASIGTVIGTLSVPGASGSFTYTLTSNPGGLFSISGSSLEVAAALSVGSHAISIRASNGAGIIINQPFAIVVTPVASYSPTFELFGF